MAFICMVSDAIQPIIYLINSTPKMSRNITSFTFFMTWRLKYFNIEFIEFLRSALKDSHLADLTVSWETKQIAVIHSILINWIYVQVLYINEFLEMVSNLITTLSNSVK